MSTVASTMIFWDPLPGPFPSLCASAPPDASLRPVRAMPGASSPEALDAPPALASPGCASPLEPISIVATVTISRVVPRSATALACPALQEGGRYNNTGATQDHKEKGDSEFNPYNAQPEKE